MYYLLSAFLGALAMFVILTVSRKIRELWRLHPADMREFGDFVEDEQESLAFSARFLLQKENGILRRMQGYDCMHWRYRLLFLEKYGAQFWESVLLEITAELGLNRTCHWPYVRRNFWEMQQYAPESWLKLQEQCARRGRYYCLRDMFPHQEIPAELLGQTKRALLGRICDERTPNQEQHREFLQLLKDTQDYKTIREIIEKLEDSSEMREAYLLALQSGDRLPTGT